MQDVVVEAFEVEVVVEAFAANSVVVIVFVAGAVLLTLFWDFNTLVSTFVIQVVVGAFTVVVTELTEDCVLDVI